MDWRAECGAVIPCWNESATIRALVQAVRVHLPSVFVVDDGSNDSTLAEAQAVGARVLSHETTRGKGAALHTGWRSAREAGLNWALALDGDGQHAPEDIPRFFECVENTSADLVVGNRMAEPAGMPWIRRQVNRWMSARISRVAGRPLPDSQCGFRLMQLQAWAATPLVTSHFEIESELLLAFIRAGRRVEFVPVRTIYKNEHSKIHPLRDAIRWFKWFRAARHAPGRR